MKQELIQKERATQIPEVEILNKEDRIFKAWGSVEVRDKEGDLLPMNEFKKIMPIIMKRGGALMDTHTNRTIGKILNYEFRDKETSSGSLEGVYLTCQIHSDYELDDSIWKGIKDGEYEGLSFGGRNKFEELKFEKGMDVTKVLTGLEGFEFSVVPSMANQEATMDQVNYLAKSNKGFGGYKDFQDCVNQNSDKKDPKSYCGFVQSSIEKAEKDYIEDKIEKEEQNKNNSSLQSSSKKEENFIKNSDSNKSMEDKKKIGEEDMNSEVTPETNPLEEIKSMLSQILSAVATNKQEVPEEDKTEEEKPKEEEEVEKGEASGSAVTLPKTVDEKAQDEKPGEGAESDEVKFVEKVAELKKEVTNEIRKELGLTKETTPRVANDNLINKSEDKTPKSFKDLDKIARGFK